MLKFKISLTDQASILKNVKMLDPKMKEAYRENVVQVAKDFAESSQQALDEAIKANPNFEKYKKYHKYGNLKESITYKVDHRRLTARVGPDLRKAPYAEWVEFGHWAGAFSDVWFSGYHYMYKGWLRVKDEAKRAITKSLANELKYYARTVNNMAKHKKTGKFVGRV
jgi:hypothetical protein